MLQLVSCVVNQSIQSLWPWKRYVRLVGFSIMSVMVVAESFIFGSRGLCLSSWGVRPSSSVSSHGLFTAMSDSKDIEPWRPAYPVIGNCSNVGWWSYRTGLRRSVIGNAYLGLALLEEYMHLQMCSVYPDFEVSRSTGFSVIWSSRISPNYYNINICNHWW